MEKKNGFHQPENLRCQLSFTPNSNNGFYSSNIALTKKLIFPLSRKLVCASRMKDIEKQVSTAGVWFVFKN